MNLLVRKRENLFQLTLSMSQFTMKVSLYLAFSQIRFTLLIDAAKDRCKRERNIYGIQLSDNVIIVKIILLRMMKIWKNIQVCAAREAITYCFKLYVMCLLLYTLILKQLPVIQCFLTQKGLLWATVKSIHFTQPLVWKKIVIFRSLQQSAEEIYNLSHFIQENVAFFNKANFFSAKRCCFCCVSSWKIHFSCWIIFIWIKIWHITWLVFICKKTKIFWA